MCRYNCVNKGIWFLRSKRNGDFDTAKWCWRKRNVLSLGDRHLRRGFEHSTTVLRTFKPLHYCAPPAPPPPLPFSLPSPPLPRDIPEQDLLWSRPTTILQLERSQLIYYPLVPKHADKPATNIIWFRSRQLYTQRAEVCQWARRNVDHEVLFSCPKLHYLNDLVWSIWYCLI